MHFFSKPESHAASPAPAAGREHVPAARTQPLSSARQPLCFIVDDEPGIRYAVAVALDRLGIQTAEFVDAAALIDAAAERQPALIFLDVSLTTSDAVEALRGLDAKRYAGAVQLMSGKDSALLEDIKLIGERRGLRMLPVLTKPFRLRDIRAIVERENLTGTTAAPLPHDSSRAGSAETPAEAAAAAVTLERALQERWIEAWYQPKLDLRSRALVGVEALVRGRHPQHGLLSPRTLLAGAGEASLARLSEFMIAAAMRDWEIFAAAGAPLVVAVNVPVSSLISLPLASLIRESRPKAAAWPGLILEVTEDEVVRDIPLVHEIATQLRVYGASLAIDDFGSGYSSFARLREFPFSELKLDQSFVKNCASDPTNQSLCHTIIDLAHSFGSVAVAEGIEQAADLHALTHMGCDLGQGYLLAVPMAKDQCVAYVRDAVANRRTR
jgi:EAL domain-containing protein (putative c-di-GMP-specific phosphodiesterase class I)/CheY-like chemotaxis protein